MAVFIGTSRRFAIVTILAVTSLLILVGAWYWAGYMPSTVIRLPRLLPAAMANTADGAVLIAATQDQHNNVVFQQMEGPLQLIDPNTGQFLGPPIEIPTVKGSELFDVRLSKDGSRVIIVRKLNGDVGPYRIEVFDRGASRWVAERDFPWDSPGWSPRYEQPSVILNSDGSRAYCETWEKVDSSKDRTRGLIAWDATDSRELFHLKRCDHASLSSDGGQLAVRANSTISILDAKTGTTIQKIDAERPVWDWDPRPRFSEGGRYFAFGTQSTDSSSNRVAVAETLTGKVVLDTPGYSPRFLVGGFLIYNRASAKSLKAMADAGQPEKAHEVVIHDVTGGREVRADVFDLGFSPLSGIVVPHPFALDSGNRYALIHETGGGWWTGSPRSSFLGDAGSFFNVPSAFNFPRGLGLVVVEAAGGVPITYHLDGATRWYPFPTAQRILIPRENDEYQVWDITPHKNYRGLVLVGAGLAIIWAATFTLRWGIRRRRTASDSVQR